MLEHRRMATGALTGLCAAALCAAWTATLGGLAFAAAPAPSDQVRVAQGVLRGRVLDGVAVYRAVPYAAPPVGPLRFKAPQMAKAWTGVRPAIDEGASCPQTAGGDPAGKGSVTEDCLLLNVFTPAAKATGKRPVMVWIHGGGFNEGFAGARQYDPTPLVKEGGIVVVSINYRLGALGLLATRSLDEANGQASGNWAIRDQQEALRWVKANIAAFGGDPANVTIVGESAGAASIVALVASPQSKGLFEKAIGQSLPDNGHVASRAKMEQTGEELAAAVGCKDAAGQVDCLRKVPVEAFLKVRKKLTMVQDPNVLPQDPYASARDGTLNRVPMIMGSNLHEGYFFVSGAERRLGHAMSPDEAMAQARTDFDEDAEALLALYPSKAGSPAAVALGEAEGDLRFSCYAHLERLGGSKYAPVYGYELNEPEPVQQQPRQKFSLDNTDYHTTDLAYLFDYDTAPLKGDAAALGRRMRAYWIAFVKTGSPETKGQPAWPRFQGASGVVLNLSNRGGTTTDFETRHKCAALQQAGLVTWDMK